MEQWLELSLIHIFCSAKKIVGGYLIRFGNFDNHICIGLPCTFFPTGNSSLSNTESFSHGCLRFSGIHTYFFNSFLQHNITSAYIIAQIALKIKARIAL